MDNATRNYISLLAHIKVARPGQNIHGVTDRVKERLRATYPDASTTELLDYAEGFTANWASHFFLPKEFQEFPNALADHLQYVAYRLRGQGSQWQNWFETLDRTAEAVAFMRDEYARHVPFNVSEFNDRFGLNLKVCEFSPEGSEVWHMAREVAKNVSRKRTEGDLQNWFRAQRKLAGWMTDEGKVMPRGLNFKLQELANFNWREGIPLANGEKDYWQQTFRQIATVVSLNNYD